MIKKVCTKNTDISLITISGSIYLFNPILGIFVLSLILLSNTDVSDRAYYFLYICIGLFYGLLNTTRVPESDLLKYKYLFDDASLFQFLDYLKGFKTDIIYYAINYILNMLLFGNFNLYIILITFLQYYLILISLHKFFIKQGKDWIIIGAFLLFLSAPVFFSSIHLLRQMLAASIFIYFIVEKIINNKNIWWLIPIAGLIHSSSIVLFIISYIPELRKRINVKNIATVFFIGIILIYVGSYIISILDQLTSNIRWLNYPIQRIYTMEELDYGWYRGNVWSVRNSYLRYILLPILIAYISRRNHSENYYLYNLCIIFTIILELYVFNNLKYMQMRMSYYFHPMRCFTITLMLKSISERINLSMYKLLLAIILSFFIYKYIKDYTNTGFKILEFDDVILRPIFVYIYDLM